MKNSALLLLSAALAFTGCSKDDEVPADVRMLTAKNWRLCSSFRITTFTYPTGSGTITDDVYAISPGCDKDDYWKFQTDKTMFVDEGPSKCRTEYPQVDRSTWELGENPKRLWIGPSGSAREYELLKLTNDTLRLKLNQGLHPVEHVPYHTIYTFVSF
jgi:hypothetical protein